MKRSGQIADTTGDRGVHTTIIFTRLTRKAEECEKGKCVQDNRPAEQLEVKNAIGVILPNRSWDPDDLGIVSVRGGPTSPRIDTKLRTVRDVDYCQRNGLKYPGGRNQHQTDVPATSETRGRQHQLPELTFVLVEYVTVRDCDQ